MRKLTPDFDDLELTPKPLTQADWTDFLKTLQDISPNLAIPTDYRDFLFQYNGGTFKECISPNIDLGDLVASWFYCWDKDEEIALHTILEYSDEIEDGFLAFADDPSGNLFLINLNVEGNGEIYYCLHDNEFENGDNKKLIYHQFSDFINSLEIEQF